MSFFTKLFKIFDIKSARAKLARCADNLLEKLYEANLGCEARKQAEEIRRLILNVKFNEGQFESVANIFEELLNGPLNENLVSLSCRKIKYVFSNNAGKEAAAVDGELAVLKLKSEIKECEAKLKALTVELGSALERRDKSQWEMLTNQRRALILTLQIKHTDLINLSKRSANLQIEREAARSLELNERNLQNGSADLAGISLSSEIAGEVTRTIEDETARIDAAYAPADLKSDFDAAYEEYIVGKHFEQRRDKTLLDKTVEEI